MPTRVFEIFKWAYRSFVESSKLQKALKIKRQEKVNRAVGEEGAQGEKANVHPNVFAKREQLSLAASL